MKEYFGGWAGGGGDDEQQQKSRKLKFASPRTHLELTSQKILQSIVWQAKKDRYELKFGRGGGLTSNNKLKQNKNGRQLNFAYSSAILAPTRLTNTNHPLNSHELNFF